MQKNIYLPKVAKTNNRKILIVLVNMVTFLGETVSVGETLPLLPGNDDVRMIYIRKPREYNHFNGLDKVN